MAIKFKTLCAIGALLLCSNNALAMPDNSRDQSSRNNMANVGSSDKSYIVLLYDYCQNKNTPISISDLTFEYEMNNKGCFNCIATINGETFDKNLSCRTRMAAKNEIAGYVLEELVKRDGYPQATNLSLDDSDSESSSDDSDSNALAGAASSDDSDSESSSDDNSSNALDQTASSDDSDSGSSSDDSSNI